MDLPQETAYNPISAADAVIRYAGNFVPSWAGAIAIDLLPAVLVLILAITQAAIRSGPRWSQHRGDPDAGRPQGGHERHEGRRGLHG